MVNAATGVDKTGFEIIRLQVRHLVKNLDGVEASSEEIEHVTDTDAHPTHARATSALRGIDGDAIK